MMDIEKLARELGLPISDTFGPMVGACPVGDLLQRFANAVLEEAATHIDVPWQHCTGSQFASAIRSMKKDLT